MLNQQPIGALATAAISLHTDQHPTAMQALAVEPELQGPGFERGFGRIRAFGRPVAAVPNHHRTAAVLSFGDGALEVAILERMIFDLDGEALFAGIERGTASHRP